MGARSLNRVQFTLERDVVRIFGQGVGAGAADLTSVKGNGITTVIDQTATGKYTITLRDKWPGLLMFKGTVMDATTPDDWEVVLVESTVATTKLVKIAVFKGGALTDLTTDDKLLFEIVLSNSSQLPKGY